MQFHIKYFSMIEIREFEKGVSVINIQGRKII
jgi:hypothetical protein